MEQNQQLSFADVEYTNKGKGRRRKPFALNGMLHVHVAQIVYNYSDPGMEARFCSFGIFWNSTV